MPSAKNSFPADDLLARARDAAATQASAPYSGFRVGAAFVTHTGELFTGANIETLRPECVCAERNALMIGAAHGMMNAGRADVIDMIAVSCIDAGPAAGLANRSPCGLCRQMLSEFCGDDTKIIIDDGKDGALFTIDDLLPHRFHIHRPTAPAIACADLESIERAAASETHEHSLLSHTRALTINAYAPYSNLCEAALVLTDTGRAWGGVQVDYSYIGAGFSALRGAMTRAVLGGDRDHINKIVIARTGGPALAPDIFLSIIDPRLIAEFCLNGDARITMADGDYIHDFVWRDVMAAMR